MLVLTRRVGESIVIAEQVVIRIVDIDRNKVRIGIVAEKDIPIHRHEVFVEMRGQQALDNLFAGVVS